MTDIRPCPFCGARDVQVIDGSTFRWRLAQCQNCNAQAGEVRVQTAGAGTPDEWEVKATRLALDEWNKGANMTDITTRIREWAANPGSTSDRLLIEAADEIEHLRAALELQQRSYEREISLEVAEERERCAKLADEYATWGGSNFAAWFNKLAAAIRGTT